MQKLFLFFLFSVSLFSDDCAYSCPSGTEPFVFYTQVINSSSDYPGVDTDPNCHWSMLDVHTKSCVASSYSDGEYTASYAIYSDDKVYTINNEPGNCTFSYTRVKTYEHVACITPCESPQVRDPQTGQCVDNPCIVPNSSPDAWGDSFSHCVCNPPSVPTYTLLGDLQSCEVPSCPTDFSEYPLVASNVSYDVCFSLMGGQGHMQYLDQGGCCYVDSNIPSDDPSECSDGFHMTIDGTCQPDLSDENSCPPGFFYSSITESCLEESPEHDTDPDFPDPDPSPENGSTLPDPDKADSCPDGQYFSYWENSCIEMFPDTQSDFDPAEDGRTFLENPDGTTAGDIAESLPGNYPDTNTTSDENTTDINGTIAPIYDPREIDAVLGAYGNVFVEIISGFTSEFSKDMFVISTVDIPVSGDCGCQNPDIDISLLGKSYYKQIDICSSLDSFFEVMRPLLWFFYIISLLFLYLRSN